MTDDLTVVMSWPYVCASVEEEPLSPAS